MLESPPQGKDPSGGAASAAPSRPRCRAGVWWLGYPVPPRPPPPPQGCRGRVCPTVPATHVWPRARMGPGPHGAQGCVLEHRKPEPREKEVPFLVTQ